MTRSTGTQAFTPWFFALVFLAGVVVGFSLMPQRPVHKAAYTPGWCCLERGTACMGEKDPVWCAEEDGFAFARNEIFCSVACGSPSLPHAASARNSR